MLTLYWGTGCHSRAIRSKGKIAVRDERQKWEHMVVLYLISPTGYSLVLGHGRHLQKDLAVNL